MPATRATYNPGIVFKSTTPAKHRALVQSRLADRDRAVAAMTALADTLVPGSEAWVSKDQNWDIEMLGVLAPSPDTVPPPGMQPAHVGLEHHALARLEGRAAPLVFAPYKRTTKGREIVAQMQALTHRPSTEGQPHQPTTSDPADSNPSRVRFVLADDQVYAIYALRFAYYDTHGDGGPDWTPIPWETYMTAQQDAVTLVIT